MMALALRQLGGKLQTWFAGAAAAVRNLGTISSTSELKMRTSPFLQPVPTVEELLRERIETSRPIPNFANRLAEAVQQRADLYPVHKRRIGTPIYSGDPFSLARDLLQTFNKDKNANLELLKVLKVSKIGFDGTQYVVLEACDPAAARVPVKYKAVFSSAWVRDRKLYEFLPLKPAPFMRVVHSGDSVKNNIMSKAECETLLYANVRECSVIDKRLGLKSRHGLDVGVSRGDVVKLDLDNHECAHSICSLAKFAVMRQNENEVARLRFSRVVAAWRELIPKERSLNHIMIEARDAGDFVRNFYAAVLSTPCTKEQKLMDWVEMKTLKATMN